MRRAACGLAALVLACAAACAPPRIALPTGAGSPFPEFASAHADAVAECRDVRALSASLSVSGRAGSTKVPSVRIDAGFSAPDRIRLEGYPRIAFGGKPFFVLVSRGHGATLVLTRDSRVLRGAPPAAIIEALAGVALEPAELAAVVAGCGLGPVRPSGGRSYPNGWLALDAAGTATFLRQIEGRWRIAAVQRGPLTVEYGDFAAGRPSVARIRAAAAPGTTPAELSLRVSQLEINPSLEDAVFNADVPRDAAPLTLDELRRAGPLGGRPDARPRSPEPGGAR